MLLYELSSDCQEFSDIKNKFGLYIFSLISLHCVETVASREEKVLYLFW